MKTKISRILGVGVTLALLASLLVGVVPASANVTSATLTLTHATQSLADDISQGGVTYTATFQIGATVTNPQVIIVSFPTGTNLAAATATLSASSGIATDAFSGAPATLTPTATGCTVTIPVAGAPMNGQGAIGAGALVQMVIANVTNAPTTGTYTLGISTTTEPVPVASDTFTLVPPTIPGVPGIVYGKNAAGNTLVTLTGVDVISTVINWAPTIVTVEVGPGTYDETAGNFTGDGIIHIPAGVTVISTAGAGSTIITDDGPIAPDGTGGCVQLNGATSVFDGFTVTGNATTPSVNIAAAGGIVRNCVLSNSGGAPALWANAGGTSSGNTISAATGQLGLWVDAAATSTGDSYSAAGTGVAITANANLTLTSATVVGASGTGLTTTAGTTTVTGSSFSNLNVGINANGGTVSLSTSTLDACGFASTTVPTGAIQIGAGTIRAIGNTITNGPNAIARVTGAGDATSTFKFNTLTGNVASFVNTAAGGGTAILDATNNWWGSSAGPTVASSAVVGGVGVITSPWLIAEASNLAVSAPGALALNSQAINGVNVAVTNNVDAPTFIATANYDGNPVTAAPPADTVRSFDVYIAYAPGQGLGETATLTFFGITGANAQVWAYSDNQDIYVLCSTQRVDMFNGSVVVTVNGTGIGGLTTPNLGNMIGLEFVLTQPSATPPAAPAQGSLVPAQAATGVDVELTSFSWGAVAGATSYDFELAVYLAGSADPFIPSLTIISENLETNGIILLTETLEYLETYAWRVRANNAVGPSAWTTGFFTTAAEPPEPPADPVWIIEQEPTQIEWPDNITIEVPPIEQPEIPEYILWVVVAVGAILVIAVVVLIVRTRRVA